METLKITTEKENLRIEEQKRLIENRLKEVEPLLKVIFNLKYISCKNRANNSTEKKCLDFLNFEG